MANIEDSVHGHGGQFGSIRLFRDQQDGTYTVDQSGLLYAWDTNSLAWVRVTADSSGRLVLSSGKTLLFATIAQGGAGTTQLVAASASNKVKVVSYAFTCLRQVRRSSQTAPQTYPVPSTLRSTAVLQSPETELTISLKPPL